MRDRFREAGIPNAELDARILAQRAFGLDQTALAMREHDKIGAEHVAALDALAERRLSGEPVARIEGEKEFFGLTFGLNAATLVPRSETELLADLTLEALQGVIAPTILDLGTGTGCIAISVLYHCPDARAVATDFSPDALDMARRNAERHGVAGRIEFRGGDWYGPMKESEIFDVVVSNPPYIVHSDIGTLDLDVRGFDPHLALDGGPDGLGAHRQIAEGASSALKPGGSLILEIGAGQGQAVARLLAGEGFPSPEIRRDLAGHDRVVLAQMFT